MEIKYCLRFFKVGSETCFVGFDYDHAPPVPRIGETVDQMKRCRKAFFWSFCHLIHHCLQTKQGVFLSSQN